MTGNTEKKPTRLTAEDLQAILRPLMHEVTRNHIEYNTVLTWLAQRGNLCIEPREAASADFNASWQPIADLLTKSDFAGAAKELNRVLGLDL